jgi:hypothetical protein
VLAEPVLKDALRDFPPSLTPTCEIKGTISDNMQASQATDGQAASCNTEVDTVFDTDVPLTVTLPLKKSCLIHIFALPAFVCVVIVEMEWL